MEKSLNQPPAGQSANLLERHNKGISERRQVNPFAILKTERRKGGRIAKYPCLDRSACRAPGPSRSPGGGPTLATVRLSLSMDSAWPAVGSTREQGRLTGPTYMEFRETTISSVMAFT